MKVEPGDHINILVDGQPVTTEIDEHGTQRFLQNDVVCWLFSSGQISMHQLWIDFYTNSEAEITDGAMMEFYMSLGYTVGGFDEMFGEGSSWESNGKDPIEILNPCWELDKETVH